MRLSHSGNFDKEGPGSLSKNAKGTLRVICLVRRLFDGKKPDNRTRKISHLPR